MLYQGEVPRQAFIIKRGLVRAYTITRTGEERIISIKNDNHILPITWIFDQTPNALFYYETITDSEIVTVPKTFLVKSITESPILMQYTLDQMMNEHSSLLLRVTALTQANATEKIALTFFYLILRFGTETKPGEYNIGIRLTQSMIASLVGLTRESTTINLKILKKKSIIKCERFTYTVNKPMLEQFVGEDSFHNMPSLNR